TPIMRALVGGIAPNSAPAIGLKCLLMIAELEWIKLYRAALRETDPEKQVSRIEEAKRAMKQALRMAVEYEDSDQRHAISEALSHLEIILCSSVRLCRIMLLALGLQAEFSLKLLHDSCGLRL